MTPARYSRSAIVLHWAIALFLAFQLALGWRLGQMQNGPGLFAAYQLHKSVGISILMLSLARVAIRLIHPRPAPSGDELWAQRLAKCVHALLYGFMIGGPVTGWALVSTAKIKVPTLIFGIVPWPHLPLSATWRTVAESSHALIGWIGLSLIGLHIAGALRHQFVKGEDQLSRILPFAVKRPVAVTFGVLAILWCVHGAGWKIPFATQKAQISVPAAPAGPTPSEARPALPPVGVAGERAILEPPVVAVDQPAAKLPAPTIPKRADWEINSGGHLGFAATWANTPVPGKFSRWTGKIRFDPDALDQANIRIIVDLSSADTADSQRDAMLSGDSFFNTAVHPSGVYRTTKLKALGGDRYTATGILSLHGVTLPVPVNFTVTIKGESAHVAGAGSIDRTAFGVGSGQWAATDQIGGTVAISFNFSAQRAGGAGIRR
jgi:cytochrome b561/polyisoprenoid-binding protein YceI